MRVNDKIKEIETYLEELRSFVPTNLKEYKENYQVKAACERYFEKIIEAVVDLVFLIIKDKGWKSPEDEKSSFEVLVEEKMITKELADRLKDAKGMRNILAHEYGSIDDEIVFNSITEELNEDVTQFVDRIKRKI